MKTKAESYKEALLFLSKHQFAEQHLLVAFIQLILKGVETPEAIKILDIQ